MTPTKTLRPPSYILNVQSLINFDRMEDWILKPHSRFESRTLDWESSTLTTSIIVKTYLKCKCLVFINIKQTLVNRVNIIRETFIFYAFFTISSLDNVLRGCFRQVFFHLGDKKKWSLVVLDRWSSYAVTIIWELAWADSALVALGKWLSYRDGRINRFDCNIFLNKLMVMHGNLLEN